MNIDRSSNALQETTVDTTTDVRPSDTDELARLNAIGQSTISQPVELFIASTNLLPIVSNDGMKKEVLHRHTE